MRVTVRDAASLLDSTDEQVLDWIESGGLPAYRIDDQYRINRSELLEWATAHSLHVNPALFHETEDEDHIPSVAECLERGGVFHGVAGGSKDEAIRSIIALLNLDDEGDRELLLHILLARNAAGVVPVGHGVAIPHVRNPISLSSGEASLSLFFLEEAVDFDAPDGKPVFAFFFLVSPTTRVHLQMLARVAYLLLNTEFREAISARESARVLIEKARILEASA